MALKPLVFLSTDRLRGKVPNELYEWLNNLCQSLVPYFKNLDTVVSRKARTYTQPTAPTSWLQTGDIWFDSNDGNRMYRWSGTEWLDTQDAGIAQAIMDAATAQSTADGRIVTFFGSVAPTAEGVGDLWIDGGDGNRLHRWTGTEWLDIQDGGIGDALASAATAQETADGKIVTFVQDSAPTAEGIGDLWMDSNDNYKPYRWGGDPLSWVPVAYDVATWSKIIGDGKPEDGATKGATWGVNITNQPASIRQIFYAATAPALGMSTGDLFVDSDDNKLYRYNGATWGEIQDDAIATALSNAATAQSTADGKIKTFVQTSAPTASDVGDIWFDSDDGYKMYHWSGSLWVDVRDTGIAAAIAAASGAQGTADGKVVTFVQAAAPTATAVGDLWIDSDDANKLYRWSGAQWVLIRDTGIATALTDASNAQTAANNAQSTANTKIITFIQTSAPTASETGDLWMDSDDNNKPYRWNGSQWVACDYDVATWSKIVGTGKPEDGADVTAAHASSIIYHQSTAPATPQAGWIWYDTSASPTIVKRYNGSTWDVCGVDLTIWQNGVDPTKLDGNNLAPQSVTTNALAANSVLAANISAASLSAIVAFLGDVVAGSLTGTTITGGLIRTATSGRYIQMDADGIKFFMPATVGIFGTTAGGGSNLVYGTTGTGGSNAIYGSGMLARFYNINSGIPFDVVCEQTSVGDMHLVNRASDPTTGKTGDIALVNNHLRVCTSVTPTWANAN